MAYSEKRPEKRAWSAPRLRRIEPTDGILRELGCMATPEQLRRIDEMRKTLARTNLSGRTEE